MTNQLMAVEKTGTVQFTDMASLSRGLAADGQMGRAADDLQLRIIRREAQSG
jgi:hypothetical protein